MLNEHLFGGPPQRFAQPEFLPMTKDRRLQRAQLVARLHHPNLARMLPLPGGSGFTPVTNGARRLADFSTPEGGFDGLKLEQLVWVVLDVLSGLRALHELTIDGSGFVHASISPQHVLLGEPGNARLVPVTSAHLNAKVACETIGYAAPEALLGSTADLRADLFSVGVLLWEALAQQRLFPDGSRDAVVARLSRGEAPALRGLVGASWALPLCRVVERAIAIDPNDRFDSALDLSSAIVAAVGPRLTSPQRGADSPRAEAEMPAIAAAAAPEPTPRAPRWRTVTPLPVVLDLPLPPCEPEATVASEPAAAHFSLPPPPQGQRWQPILAGLAVASLAWAVWQLVPRPTPYATAQQSSAAPLAPPTHAPVRPTRATEPVSAPEQPTRATEPVSAPMQPTRATEPVSAPPASVPAKVAISAARPLGSRLVVPPARSAASRKPRPKLPSADSDYGI
jgi:hypothetical protein